MSRTVATARQVLELTGFLLHVSFALRPGKFVVGRLLAAAGKSQSAAFPAGVVNPGRRVVLGPEFHDVLEFWRWFVAHGLASRGEQFTSPMYNIVTRPPQLTLFSDASKQAVGGYCLETGQYWRYDLSAEEQPRCCGSAASLVGVNDVSVKVGRVFGLGSA